MSEPNLKTKSQVTGIKRYADSILRASLLIGFAQVIMLFVLLYRIILFVDSDSACLKPQSTAQPILIKQPVAILELTE